MIAFAFALLVLCGVFFQVTANKKSDLPPVADGKEARENIIVYTTLPADVIGGLALEYERNYDVSVQIRQISENELKAALQEKKIEPGALVFSEASFLEQNKQAFMPVITEQTDMLRKQFHEADGLWTGLWFDPIVFAVNRDNNLPKLESWSDLTRKESSFRLGIADFILSDQAALPFYYTVQEMEEGPAFEFWRQLHPKITQYAKFFATPVRMVALGEADLSIVFQSEALRYIQDGFPISTIQPQPSTPYMLFGMAAVQAKEGCSEKKLQFIEWLMLDTPQYLLEQKHIFWLSVHPDTLQYRRYATRLKLADANKLPPEARKLLLDAWVRKVRLGSN